MTTEQPDNSGPAAEVKRRPWAFALMAVGGVGLLGAAAVAIYVLFFDVDRDWEACKSPELLSVEARIQHCGAVILADEQTPKALAFARRTRARAYFGLGELASAVQDYSYAIETTADDPALLAERGVAYLRNGQPDKAATDFTAALALDATLIEPLVARGNAYMALQKPNLAANDFTAALIAKPDLTEAVYRRALANLRMNRIAAASADYDRAIELEPKNPNYWNARCWFRATMSIDLDLALPDCDRALALKPGFVPAMDSRAFVLLRLNRLQDALSAYDKTIAVETRYAWPYFGRGIVKKRLGDEAGAQLDFDAATARQTDIAQQYANYGETP